jgi:hypothetical protein
MGKKNDEEIESLLKSKMSLFLSKKSKEDKLTKLKELNEYKIKLENDFKDLHKLYEDTEKSFNTKIKNVSPIRPITHNTYRIPEENESDILEENESEEKNQDVTAGTKRKNKRTNKKLKIKRKVRKTNKKLKKSKK